MNQEWRTLRVEDLREPIQNWQSGKQCDVPDDYANFGGPNGTKMAASPVISLPADIRTYDPAWAECGASPQAHDPPRVLIPVDALDATTTTLPSGMSSPVAKPKASTTAPTPRSTTPFALPSAMKTTTTETHRHPSSLRSSRTRHHAVQKSFVTSQSGPEDVPKTTFAPQDTEERQSTDNAYLFSHLFFPHRSHAERLPTKLLEKTISSPIIPGDAALSRLTTSSRAKISSSFKLSPTTSNDPFVAAQSASEAVGHQPAEVGPSKTEPLPKIWIETSAPMSRNKASAHTREVSGPALPESDVPFRGVSASSSSVTAYQDDHAIESTSIRARITDTSEVVRIQYQSGEGSLLPTSLRPKIRTLTKDITEENPMATRGSLLLDTEQTGISNGFVVADPSDPRAGTAKFNAPTLTTALSSRHSLSLPSLLISAATNSNTAQDSLGFDSRSKILSSGSAPSITVSSLSESSLPSPRNTRDSIQFATKSNSMGAFGATASLVTRIPSSTLRRTTSVSWKLRIPYLFIPFIITVSISMYHNVLTF